MEARAMPTGVAVLKWYFIIVGIFGILFGLLFPVLITGIMQAAMEAAGEDLAPVALMGGLGFMWGFLIICWAIFEIIIGVNLGRGNGWSRIAAIVVGILRLLTFPVGTVLGILCLVFLLNEENKAYFVKAPATSVM